MSRQHARFSASAASRWMECPGSVVLAEKAPPREASPYAQEGTDAHSVAEAALTAACRNAREAWAYSPLAIQPTNVEMCEAVQDFLDYVYGILDAHPDAVLLVEQRFQVPVQTAPGEAWGTSDVCIYVPSLNRLYVIDYKHGAGVAVEARGNKQLRFYAAGVVFDALDVVPDEIIIGVVQPRAFHPHGPIRTEHVSFDDLLDFLVAVEAAIERALSSMPLLVPGDAQCQWCPGKQICPALEAKALRAVNEHFASFREVRQEDMPDVRKLPIARLAMLLEAKPLFDMLFSDAEEYAHELARAGHTIPGRKLVEAQAKRRWYGDEKFIAEQLVELTGLTLDDVMPRKLVTITKAEAAVVKAYKARASSKQDRNKMAEDARQALAFLTLKETSGNTSLAPMSDPRPAISLTQRTFSAVSLPPPPPPLPSPQPQ